jgi:hypothetical protein
MTLVKRSVDIIPINAHDKRQYVFFLSLISYFPPTTIQKQILQRVLVA